MSNEFIARKGLISLDTITGLSGSKFGSNINHTHQITGSLSVSGALNVGGVASSPNYFGDSSTDLHIFTGDVRVTGSTSINGALNVFSGSASSGSAINTFGNSNGDQHIFSGSVLVRGIVSGSLVLPAGTVSSSLQINTGSFSGSLIGTSSWAQNSISSSFATTASYASNADLLDGFNSSIFATTGSNNFVGNQIVSGNMSVSGSTILSGTVNIAGGGIDPNIFGDSVTDQHIFTGSLLVNGQINVNSGIEPNTFGDTLSDIHIFTGSLLINGRVSGSSFTGSLLGTSSNAASASYASNADLLDGVNSTVFATTGSNIFVGNQTITGSVNISGSTILSGSVNIAGVASSPNYFGDSSTDLHIFTGDVRVTGSTTVNGALSIFSGSIGSGSAVNTFGNSITDQHIFSGSTTFSGTTTTNGIVTVNNNTLVITGSRIAIDKAIPTADLDVSGSVFITGSLNVTAGITGSLSGTAVSASNLIGFSEYSASIQQQLDSINNSLNISKLTLMGF